MAKIEFDRYDFVAGTVTKVSREIDSAKVLAGNAFFQLVKPAPAPVPADTAPSEWSAPESDPA